MITPGLCRPPPPPAAPAWLARRRCARPRRRAPSKTAILFDEDAVEERTQLTFVNYAEELEEAKMVTLTDLLSKFTYLKDVSCNSVGIDDFKDYHSDVHSDGYDSDYTSSSTASIVD